MENQAMALLESGKRLTADEEVIDSVTIMNTPHRK